MAQKIPLTSHLLAWHLEAFTWKIQTTAAEPSAENEWVERANSEIAPLRPWIRRGSETKIGVSVGTVAVLLLAMAEYVLVMEETEDPVAAGRMLGELSQAYDVIAKRDQSIPSSQQLIQNPPDVGWPAPVLARLFQEV